MILIKINCEPIRARNNSNKLYRENIQYSLRKNVSSAINRKINKGRNSCLKYLPFNLIELKDCIESQFEDWMNWDNRGSI